MKQVKEREREEVATLHRVDNEGSLKTFKQRPTRREKWSHEDTWGTCASQADRSKGAEMEVHLGSRPLAGEHEEGVGGRGIGQIV